MRKILKWAGLGLLGVIAISFLGGSAMWTVLGFGDDLTIEGRAEVVRDVPADMGLTWQAYGGDGGGMRFSQAGDITPDTVNALTPVWTYQSGAFKGREHLKSRSAFQVTPILVQDALIFCTQFNEIISIDARTGAENWRFDAEIPLDGSPANAFTCRGVSYWSGGTDDTSDTCRSRVFMGTVDARIVAVDALTGTPCMDFGTNGAVQIEPSLALHWPGEFQITSAPAIIGDIVVTGTSIGDNLRTDAPIGTVHAFDVRTGTQVWKFNPIPWGQDDDGARIGHANVWSTLSVDAARDLVFLPTSTASPDYYGGDRPGDNRHANSVVALRGTTGELVWAYQFVHHDVWDYDLPSQPGLYQVWRDGYAHDVMVQVTKMGLVFVLDRETGQPFLPIEERPVPQNGVDGEHLSPTQPFPVNTPPIVPNTLDPGKAFGITLWDKMACKKQFKALRDDGLYTPPTVEGSLNYPFSGGGANWGSAAFDPTRNLLIINMNNAAQALHLYPDAGGRNDVSELSHDAEFAPMNGAPYGMSRELILSPLGLPCTPPPWGVLAGVNLDSGEIVWRKTLGTTEDLAPGGLALNLGTPAFGGPITTAGGVTFIGAAMDNYLRAFDTATGQELWKGRLPAGGQATPMTYEIEGRQFVVIAAGGHGRAGTDIGDYIVAFALEE